MMDLTCRPQSFSCPSWHLQIPLIFLLTVTLQPTVTEITKRPILLSGEIGGEVTFCCPYNNQSSISSFYLQKGGDFVNGYHRTREIPIPKWQNTRLDHENVHMNHLNISHAGKYTCHFVYTDKTWDETDIELSITAPYTRPNVTMSCSDTGHNCKVTCTSHGGYPKNKFSWDVPPLGNASGPTWGAVENPPECDPKTKLCNISSTASFNCSFGLRRDLHCYVDDNPEIFSAFSVCKPLSPTPPSDPPTVLIAVGAMVIVVIILGVLLLLWKFRKGLRGRRNQMTGQELNMEAGQPLWE